MIRGCFEEAFAKHISEMTRRRQGTMIGRLVVTVAILLTLLWAAEQLGLG